MSSTIHQHRPIHLNLWWVAAAAVLVGAVLALMILTFRSAGSAAVVTPPAVDQTMSTRLHDFKSFGCFAGHTVPNIELSGCVSPVR